MATRLQEIQQATSTVQMLEQMVKARRASAQELATARERLALLEAPALPQREVVIDPDSLEPVGTAISQAEFLELQAELSKDAERINRQMADLSNQLHKVPPGNTCSELVRPILAMKEQIETIWDKKRYLERNRCLPEERATAEVAGEQSPEKFRLAYEKRRLVDLRSKLHGKLKNPAARPGKVQEWREELQRANLEIAEIDIQLGTL